MKFKSLPASIRHEMMKRHTHAETQNEIDPETIVYLEQDVIDLMELFHKRKAPDTKIDEGKNTVSYWKNAFEIVSERTCGLVNEIREARKESDDWHSRLSNHIKENYALKAKINELEEKLKDAEQKLWTIQNTKS